MYLKIENAGELNRKKLELIGYTDKADEPADSRIVGQWGTGTKFAAIAALRLGLDVVITSTDSFGRYFLCFETEAVDMGDGTETSQVILSYWVPDGEGGIKNIRLPWHVTADAFRDWDKPIGSDTAKAFKVMREFICNARDADPGFTIEYVGGGKREFAPEGRTAVYLNCTPDIVKVMTRPERYFKFIADDIGRMRIPAIGEVTDKAEQKNTRLFVQGVLVSCSSDYYQKSVLDYNVDRRNLVSEDRTVKNIGMLKKEMGRLLANIADKKIAFGLLTTMIEGKARFEIDCLGTVESIDEPAKSVWREALSEVYGNELLCATSYNNVTDQDAAQIYGHRVISGDTTMVRFFETAIGIPKASKIALPSPGYSLFCFSDLEEESQERFLAAFRIFAKYWPDRADLPITFFQADDPQVREKISAFAGLGDAMFKEIWLQVVDDLKLRSTRHILRALVHESRHCVTGVGDYDRVFVRRADDTILDLVCRCLGMTTNIDGKELPSLGDPYAIEPNIEDPLILEGDVDIDSDIETGSAEGSDAVQQSIDELLAMYEEDE